MVENKSNAKHNVIMQNRDNISMTGVIDVLSFDEEQIVTETEQGILILKGLDLHVTALNLENGALEIDGQIVSLTYEETSNFAQTKGSFFGRIFK